MSAPGVGGTGVNPVQPILDHDQLAIIEAYRAFTATVAGPATLSQQPETRVPVRQQPTITDIVPLQGSAGTEVQINGTNLRSASAVLFGQQAANNVAVTSGKLTATVAGGLASGAEVKVAVVTPLGTAFGPEPFVVK